MLDHQTPTSRSSIKHFSIIACIAKSYNTTNYANSYSKAYFLHQLTQSSPQKQLAQLENLEYQDPSHVEFEDPISLYRKFTNFFLTNSLFQLYYNGPSEVNTRKKMKNSNFLASLSRDLLNQKYHAQCNPKLISFHHQH